MSVPRMLLCIVIYQVVANNLSQLFQRTSEYSALSMPAFVADLKCYSLLHCASFRDSPIGLFSGRVEWEVSIRFVLKKKISETVHFRAGLNSIKQSDK